MRGRRKWDIFQEWETLPNAPFTSRKIILPGMKKIKIVSEAWKTGEFLTANLLQNIAKGSPWRRKLVTEHGLLENPEGKQDTNR